MDISLYPALCFKCTLTLRMWNSWAAGLVGVFYTVTALLLQNYYLKKKKKENAPLPKWSQELYQTKGDWGPLLIAHLQHNPRGSCSLQSPNPCAATADCLTYKSPTSCCWHWELLPKMTWQLEEPGTRVSSQSGHIPQWQVSPGAPSYTARGGIYMETTSPQEREIWQDHCRSAPECKCFERTDVAQSRGARILLRFLTLARKGEWWISIYEVLQALEFLACFMCKYFQKGEGKLLFEVFWL